MNLSGNTVLITGGGTGIGPAVAGVMADLARNTPEIGYGMTKALIRASRAEPDERFRQMNAEM